MVDQNLGGIVMRVKHDEKSIPITASEIAYLWNTYLLNSKAKYALINVVSQCDDKDIRGILKRSLEMSADSLGKIEKIFEEEKQRVPYGFSEEDVYVNVPKLYSDKLHLYLLKVFTMLGLSNYGMALSLSPRADIRKLFYDSIISTIDLSDRGDDIALEKGVYLRTPNIPATKEIEFAEDKSIMGRIIGHKRPLNALEIASIFNCSMVMSASEAYLLGMAQTMEDDRLKDFANRARKTLKENCETLNEILHKEDLNSPPELESEVLNSSTPIFSDRLSMFTCYATLTDVIFTLSVSKVGVLRKDVFNVFTQLSSDILFIMKDATDLMIERKWLEEMPKNIDREDLTYL
jgi:hypothetical protein